MDVDDWSQISLEELAARLKGLSPKQIPSIVMSIDDKSRLETVGRSLNTDQILEVFSALTNSVKRLSPIIVGIPHAVFREVMLKGDDSQLQAIKQQGMAEPLQHQLTVYLHEINQRVATLNNSYEILNKAVESIDPKILEPDTLKELWQNLCRLSRSYLELMRETSIVLLLVWNTDRNDLIEELTNSKEQCHRVCRFGVGFPGVDDEKPSGLFELLDEKLFSVYGLPEDIESAKDSEPAIEGLARISAWYLQDYWEVGLLPQIEDASELDLDREMYNADVRREYRKKLFQQVQCNLQKAGLGTVKDLKNAWIYSKKSLASYIASRT